MEIVIALVVVAAAVYWVAFRKKPENVVADAPYKVETPPAVGKSADDIVEAPAVVQPVTAKAPAKAKTKAPAKPKATKTAKATTKKAKTKPAA